MEIKNYTPNLFSHSAELLSLPAGIEVKYPYDELHYQQFCRASTHVLKKHGKKYCVSKNPKEGTITITTPEE